MAVQIVIPCALFICVIKPKRKLSYIGPTNKNKLMNQEKSNNELHDTGAVAMQLTTIGLVWVESDRLGRWCKFKQLECFSIVCP